MLITTANDLPGYEITETLGEVFGLTVRSRNVGSQLGAGLKSIMGGELKGMTKALVDSREQVIERMVEEAKELPQPVERHLLELLQRRRGAPEDADLIQAGRQHVGQDRGLGAGGREVGKEARALPVRQARQQHLLDVAQHG